MSKRSETFVVGLVVLLSACAFPGEDKPQLATATGKGPAIDIVLEKPAFGARGAGRAALESAGWSDGSLAQRFCDGLAQRLRGQGIEARCVASQWGGAGDGAAAGFEAPSQGADYVLSIQPVRLRYELELAPGPQGVNPLLETVSHLRSRRTGAAVWAGELHAGFVPEDRTGSGLYAARLLGALREAGML